MSFFLSVMSAHDYVKNESIAIGSNWGNSISCS